MHIDDVCRVGNRADDFRNDAFQKVDIPFFLGNHPFPVPLIDVNAVKPVEFIVATNCVHIGVQTFVDLESVITQSVSFPFCERLHDLAFDARVVQNVKRHDAFHAVQIIVKPRFRRYDKGCGNTL